MPQKQLGLVPRFEFLFLGLGLRVQGLGQFRA